MGANSWHYFTPYQPDINQALQQLREQEFRGERYGAEYQCQKILSLLTPEVADEITRKFQTIFQDFKLSDMLTIDGEERLSAEELIQKHGSVQAAINSVLEETEEVIGTSSILDIESVAAEPAIGTTCPLSKRELEILFKTTRPTKEMIERCLLDEIDIEDFQQFEDFWEDIGRGESRYIVLYQDDQPTEIFFAGYSFD